MGDDVGKLASIIAQGAACARFPVTVDTAVPSANGGMKHSLTCTELTTVMHELSNHLRSAPALSVIHFFQSPVRTFAAVARLVEARPCGITDNEWDDLQVAAVQMLSEITTSTDLEECHMQMICRTPGVMAILLRSLNQLFDPILVQLGDGSTAAKNNNNNNNNAEGRRSPTFSYFTGDNDDRDDDASTDASIVSMFSVSMYGGSIAQHNNNNMVTTTTSASSPLASSNALTPELQHRERVAVHALIALDNISATRHSEVMHVFLEGGLLPLLSRVAIVRSDSWMVCALALHIVNHLLGTAQRVLHVEDFFDLVRQEPLVWCTVLRVLHQCTLCLCPRGGGGGGSIRRNSDDSNATIQISLPLSEIEKEAAAPEEEEGYGSLRYGADDDDADDASPWWYCLLDEIGISFIVGETAPSSLKDAEYTLGLVLSITNMLVPRTQRATLMHLIGPEMFPVVRQVMTDCMLRQLQRSPDVCFSGDREHACLVADMEVFTLSCLWCFPAHSSAEQDEADAGLLQHVEFTGCVKAWLSPTLVGGADGQLVSERATGHTAAASPRLTPSAFLSPVRNPRHRTPPSPAAIANDVMLLCIKLLRKEMEALHIDIAADQRRASSGWSRLLQAQIPTALLPWILPQPHHYMITTPNRSNLDDGNNNEEGAAQYVVMSDDHNSSHTGNEVSNPLVRLDRIHEGRDTTVVDYSGSDSSGDTTSEAQSSHFGASIFEFLLDFHHRPDQNSAGSTSTVTTNHAPSFFHVEPGPHVPSFSFPPAPPPQLPRVVEAQNPTSVGPHNEHGMVLLTLLLSGHITPTDRYPYMRAMGGGGSFPFITASDELCSIVSTLSASYVHYTVRARALVAEEGSSHSSGQPFLFGRTPQQSLYAMAAASLNCLANIFNNPNIPHDVGVACLDALRRTTMLRQLYTVLTSEAAGWGSSVDSITEAGLHTNGQQPPSVLSAPPSLPSFELPCTASASAKAGDNAVSAAVDAIAFIRVLVTTSICSSSAHERMDLTVTGDVNFLTACRLLLKARHRRSSQHRNNSHSLRLLSLQNTLTTEVGWLLADLIELPPTATLHDPRSSSTPVVLTTLPSTSSSSPNLLVPHGSDGQQQSELEGDDANVVRGDESADLVVGLLLPAMWDAHIFSEAAGYLRFFYLDPSNQRFLDGMLVVNENPPSRGTATSSLPAHDGQYADTDLCLSPLSPSYHVMEARMKRPVITAANSVLPMSYAITPANGVLRLAEVLCTSRRISWLQLSRLSRVGLLTTVAEVLLSPTRCAMQDLSASARAMCGLLSRPLPSTSSFSDAGGANVDFVSVTSPSPPLPVGSLFFDSPPPYGHNAAAAAGAVAQPSSSAQSTTTTAEDERNHSELLVRSIYNVLHGATAGLEAYMDGVAKVEADRATRDCVKRLVHLLREDRRRKNNNNNNNNNDDSTHVADAL